MPSDESNQMVAVMREGWVLSQRLNPTPSADAIEAMTAIHFKDLEAEATTKVSQ